MRCVCIKWLWIDELEDDDVLGAVCDPLLPACQPPPILS